MKIRISAAALLMMVALAAGRSPLFSACTSVPQGDINGTPEEIWAPHEDAPVPVEIEGRFIQDTDCTFRFARLRVLDEYGLQNQIFNVTLQPNGGFRETVFISPETDRKEHKKDRDGRLYRIILGVVNDVGTGTAEAEVLVLRHRPKK